MSLKQHLEKPNYLAVQQSINDILEIDSQLKLIIEADNAQQALVRSAIKAIHDTKVRRTLEELDIEQLNNDKIGIRTSLLKDAGIRNIWRVHSLSLQQIYNIHGIGEQSAYKIKSAADTIAKNVRESTYIRISPEEQSNADGVLIQEMYRLINTKDVCIDARILYGENHTNILNFISQAKRIKNPFLWFFTARTKKESALESLVKIDDLLSGAYGIQGKRLCREFQQIMSVHTGECWKDFEQRAADYYAQLEIIDSSLVKNEEIRNGIPAQLASQIEAYSLKLNLMKSTLRRYQEFGTKYIIHQCDVLLGDEMGLGKTVQAIAAMANLNSDGKTHFMVVCPAGVLVNWCREIHMHSHLRVIKIHGGNTNAVKEWLDDGGVAVTTYESISKFSLPDDFKIHMLVADEAHYVKNPNTNRTKALLTLLAVAERSLFMTGTPLENRVEEMCFLVNCLQPAIGRQLENIKYLSSAPQFREKLAPVYLRRTREAVLKELPELIENEEWCSLSSCEKKEYFDSVMSGNFMAMRQVSWSIGELKESSKATRLLEICEMAEIEGRKVIIFSFFRDTISSVCRLMGEKCLEPITGSVSSVKRQEIIDAFTKSDIGTVLVCQVQAGGVGLNIQTASVVVFCEPQIKPSIENQAISRAYRMGQVRSVIVYRLLCEETIDERIVQILRRKQDVFDNFADESVIGNENMKMTEEVWIRQLVKAEQERICDEI